MVLFRCSLAFHNVIIMVLLYDKTRHASKLVECVLQTIVVACTGTAEIFRQIEIGLVVLDFLKVNIVND